MPSSLQRVRSVMRGVVQGVGFRPHVARTAARFAVTGLVGNDDESVFVEAQGAPAEVGAFLDAVVAQLPVLATVVARADHVIATVPDESGFRIVRSRHARGALTLIPPDVAPCDDCLREQNDPANRRYRYPFITCTNCGPRLSIIEDLPYDRPATTMREFPMCPACEREYTDPSNRRYHAQPISCFDCGPTLWLQASPARGNGELLGRWEDAIQTARSMLAAGAILAVKGIGGFTLLCDARDAAAVDRLRARKRRPHKPFAVMTADADQAAVFAAFSPAQRRELESPQRPIVLCPQGPGYDLAPGVAPGLDDVGVMLPSAPLHVLLVGPGEVYVATSANSSGEPLVYRNDDAVSALAEIVDGFLMHDRTIHVPVEDSVLMAVGDEVWPVRRSRGYAPLPVLLPEATLPHPSARPSPTDHDAAPRASAPPSSASDDASVLAVGGELKNTFAITRDGMAFLSAHIGDMGSLTTRRAFERSVEQLTSMHRRRPDIVVADLHPGYATRAWAERYADETGARLMLVQHHHAHALSLLAEQHIVGQPFTCIVADGTGYGADGASPPGTLLSDGASIWGGEILVLGADPVDYERAWHLDSFWLPGGDTAVRQPWKPAIALLAEYGLDDAGLPCTLAAPAAELRLVRSQCANGRAAVRTTSAGRLFDAVASIVGVRHEVTYEAQAAMELEVAARRCHHREHAEARFADEHSLLTWIVDGVRRGVPVPCLARAFHAGLAGIVGTAAATIAATQGQRVVGVSGGVAQNRLFVAGLRTILSESALTLLVHTVVPANDGGLCLGQALAGHLMAHQSQAQERTGR